MMKHLMLGSLKIPTYGLCVWTGFLICTVIAVVIVCKRDLPLYSFLMLEFLSALGAILGARVLALGNGYAYFGGLAGFFLTAYAVSFIFRLKKAEYAGSLMFLLPLLHVFWKIGCFMGGCCKGINGFPVQLLEAGVAFLLGILILFLQMTKKDINMVAVYLTGYGFTRFFIEFLREQKHQTSLLSGHVCAVLCTIIGIILLRRTKRGIKGNE